MRQRNETLEIVSLNTELFSLEAGNLSVEGLDRRLELVMAMAAPFICGTFGCANFGSCTEFGCGSFVVG